MGVIEIKDKILDSNNSDRISKYLTHLLDDMIFDELAKDYLKRTGTSDFMLGVPIPVGNSNVSEVDTLKIAHNMAKVIGCDPHFPYQKEYIKFLNIIFDGNADKALISEGAKSGELANFELSCAYERAALLIEPKSRDALYLYARACLDAYQSGENTEEYTGLFKAESLEMFELLTMIHPDFELGFYYLGYSYANLGLYLKAKLTWEEFIDLTEGSINTDTIKQREEINERLYHLKDPVLIEQAINEILRGNYSYGKNELAKYVNSSYAEWWPLWYYLGIAESALANYEPAIQYYKKALNFSPSNLDIMKELVEIYEAISDEDGAKKYRKKIEIIEKNRMEEASDNKKGLKKDLIDKI